MLEILKEPASKDIDVMCLKVEPDSRTPREVKAPPVVSVSVPQEKTPLLQVNLPVTALHTERPDPKSWEEEA